MPDLVEAEIEALIQFSKVDTDHPIIRLNKGAPDDGCVLTGRDLAVVVGPVAVGQDLTIGRGKVRSPASRYGLASMIGKCNMDFEITYYEQKALVA